MKVLIAEDDPTICALMEDMLVEWQYDPVIALDGEQAWSLMQGPDAARLAVLDWIMPGLDGLELCRRLKERSAQRYVYTIILTSRKEKEDIVAGFAAGADDFLSKPVEPEELRSRLAVGQRILRYEERLRLFGSHMEALAEERARQLMHAERLAVLGMLAAGLSHEISNALNSIIGNVQFLEEIWPQWEKRLHEVAGAQGVKVEDQRMIDEMGMILSILGKSGARIGNLARGLKNLARKESVRASCSLNECVEQALLLARNRIKGRRVRVDSLLEPGLPRIQANAQQIEQVLINLLFNAADAMGEAGGGTVAVSTHLQGRVVRVEVQDSGPGINLNDVDKLFSPFFTTKTQNEGTGLGLSISKAIIEEHGGVIWAENAREGGARFVIELPLPEGDDR